MLNTAVVPFGEPFFVLFVGRYGSASGSKTFHVFDSSKRNNVAMFCEENGAGCGNCLAANIEARRYTQSLCWRSIDQIFAGSFSDG